MITTYILLGIATAICVMYFIQYPAYTESKTILKPFTLISTFILLFIIDTLLWPVFLFVFLFAAESYKINAKKKFDDIEL